MDSYAVIGNPIEHSKSPLIHAAFARQTGQAMEYGRLLGRIDGFVEDVRGFFALGGKGLNVTVPFKQQAWQLADACSERARVSEAVNTLIVRDDGSLLGENTDGIGLVRDLQQNHGCILAGRRILLLGAGGATRGVLQPLLEAAPAHLTVANRTAAKAEELARRVGVGQPIRGCGFADLAGAQFDLIINATSAGLTDEVPDLPPGILAEGAWGYDLMYADRPTAFVRWVLAQGATQAVDGLGMLVEQAAESFRLWRGVMPETAPVLASLRQRGTSAA